MLSEHSLEYAEKIKKPDGSAKTYRESCRFELNGEDVDFELLVHVDHDPADQEPDDLS